MNGYICLDGWAGRERIPCEVLSETPKYYRVQLQAAAVMPSKRRCEAGDVCLVPKYAVVLQDSAGSVVVVTQDAAQ